MNTRDTIDKTVGNFDPVRVEKLDNMETIKKIDPSGMYDKIYHFPEQLEDAAKIGRRITVDPNKYSGIKNVVVAGMGGSAIGGDLVRSYLADKIKLPFYICRNYNLPKYIDKNSLVIVSSYSGNTEETISAMKQAIERNCKIACITTGGEVGRLAENNGYLKADLPPGYPPRAALGLSFAPLLYMLSKLGLTDEVDNDVLKLIKAMKNWREKYRLEIKSRENRAKELALKMFGKIPIIYSGPEFSDAIGTRWKGQICENSKGLAFNNQFPEFNHNELVGWKVIEAYRDKLIVFYLAGQDDHERVSRRMAIVREIIEKLNVELIEIDAEGDNELQRMFSLIQIGDFASLYLAILNNIDPTPVEVIDFLKNKLAE